MKIWCISDTHMLHDDIIIPKEVDCVIHAGDFSNLKNKGMNFNEACIFAEWFNKLEIKEKILIAGNHDTCFEASSLRKEVLQLMPEVVYLDGSKLHVLSNGSIVSGYPETPSFGEGWAFNVAREKINRVWENIDESVDILVTHGPPFGILDSTYEMYSKGKQSISACGDSALKKRIEKLPNIKYHIFGHIHDLKDISNCGQYISPKGQTFINASCVEDGKFKIKNHGIILTI